MEVALIMLISKDVYHFFTFKISAKRPIKIISRKSGMIDTLNIKYGQQDKIQVISVLAYL